MNRTRSRRSLRMTLAGWLRALLRRSPAVADPEQSAGRDQPGAGPAETVHQDAGLPETAGKDQTETGAGQRSGPPEHWLALARSKGPPRHWLDLIRARLGDDLSKVPWIRARALPPQAGPFDEPGMVTHAQSLPVSENQPAPASAVMRAALAEEESGNEPLPAEKKSVFLPETDARPAPTPERRVPVAMRLYPAPVGEPPQPDARSRPAPAARSLTPVENAPRPESAPQPLPQAGPGAIALEDARAGQPVIMPKAPAHPLSTPAPVPVPAAPGSEPENEDTAATEPAPQERETPPVERREGLPVWAEPVIEAPWPWPEPFAAPPQERFRPAIFPPPPAAPREEIQAQPAAPHPWPVWLEPAQAERRDERSRPAAPSQTGHWPALEQGADEDLASDEWENHQRNWQRLEHLRREQEGQLWSEWPF